MEKLAPPQMRCGVQRPSPLMNGHWGYDDKASPSPPITSPESNEWGGGHGVGDMDNRRHTTTWPTTCFYIHSRSAKNFILFRTEMKKFHIITSWRFTWTLIQSREHHSNLWSSHNNVNNDDTHTINRYLSNHHNIDLNNITIFRNNHFHLVTLTFIYTVSIVIVWSYIKIQHTMINIQYNIR